MKPFPVTMLPACLASVGVVLALGASSGAAVIHLQDTTDQFTDITQHPAYAITLHNVYGGVDSERVNLDLTNGPMVNGGPTQYQGLVEFPNLFGPGANQIPTGVNITSATLTLHAYDAINKPLNGTVSAYTMTSQWLDHPSWSTVYYTGNGTAFYGSSVFPNGITVGTNTTTPAADAQTDVGGSAFSFNVLSSLLAWQSNPSTNQGWGLLADPNQSFVLIGTGGSYGASPELTVTYADGSSVPEPASLSVMAGLGLTLLRRKKARAV